MSLTIDESRLDDAQKRLICYLRGNPQMESFLAAVIQQIQDLEQVTVAYFSIRDVDTAIGDALTRIGNLVNEPRAERGDAAFRRAIKARIITNKSTGSAEDVIAALTALNSGGDVWEYVEQFPARFISYFPDTIVSDPEPMIIASRDNTAGGVASYMWYHTTATPFGFDGDATASGFDVGDLATARE